MSETEASGEAFVFDARRWPRPQHELWPDAIAAADNALFDFLLDQSKTGANPNVLAEVCIWAAAEIIACTSTIDSAAEHLESVAARIRGFNDKPLSVTADPIRACRPEPADPDIDRNRRVRGKS